MTLTRMTMPYESDNFYSLELVSYGCFWNKFSNFYKPQYVKGNIINVKSYFLA